MLTKELLTLINEEYSIEEMSQKLNLTHKQLYYYFRLLKNKGIDFNRKYFSSGDVIYLPKKSIFSNKEQGTPIYTIKNEDLVCLIVSDFHMGNKLENKKAQEQIYNYCIKNNIHIIINAGDLSDGLNLGPPELKTHKTYLEQQEYIIKNHPFDKSIINFELLGNHDIESLSTSGQDLSTYLLNYRHDLIPIGYGKGELYLKNSKILVKHSLKKSHLNMNEPSNTYDVVIKGHSHKMNVSSNGTCIITVPSLSNLKFEGMNFGPEAIKATFKFDQGHIILVLLEHLIVGKEVLTIGSMQCQINKGKGSTKNIKYEEEYKRKILKK